MPWEERWLMDVRLRFVQDVHRPGWSVAELCRRYQVSRKTGYKWLERYEQIGPAGLVDRSHRPYSCPHATPAPIVQQILTLQHGATRFLLGCRALPEPTIEASWPVFARLFRRYGLLERIRTDNGAPFASNALGRLSTLSVWWVRLGIRPELIEPAHPEQNGRHERMHKTLKAETARPPRRTLAAQQRRLDWFRHRYNAERPHEALGQRLPASLYHVSPRPYPAHLLPIAYPGHYEVRRVSRNGGIRWGSRWVNVSHVLAELDVGFEEIDDGLWEVYFGPVWLGRLHETTCRIVESFGPRRPPRRREPQRGSVTYPLITN